MPHTPKKKVRKVKEEPRDINLMMPHIKLRENNKGIEFMVSWGNCEQAGWVSYEVLALDLGRALTESLKICAQESRPPVASLVPSFPPLSN